MNDEYACTTFKIGTIKLWCITTEDEFYKDEPDEFALLEEEIDWDWDWES